MYAIVDIETTGGHAAANGITEIAIHIHDGNRVVRHYTSLLNPGIPIPGYITALTGISNSMIASAPSFDEAAPEIYSLLSDNIFVAHNVNFDYSFVKHHLKRCGFDLVVKKLCTVRLSRKIFTGFPSYSLGTLCRNLGIEIENRHRADGDARATVILFNKLLENGGIDHINKMLKRTSAEHWLPLHLDKSEIDNLPSLPGVYYFRDAKDRIIYIGKAINLKKRVSSHFTHNDSEKKRQHFLRLIWKISHTVCANELHALVLESSEIKKWWPKYNYSQKQPAQRFGLYSYEDNRGYIRLAIDKKKKNLHPLYSFNLLHEGLVMLTKMVDQFNLNHKLCYLDKTPFAKGDESTDVPSVYNIRVKEAIESLEKQLPTFALLENGPEVNQNLCLLIERGNFWGMGYVDATESIKDLVELKLKLNPYADNDFIRNSIYSYASANPAKRISF
ncbi:MAG TPA: exonuclease domain-containing protein [Ferruginibacter sp.]|nr:exonuclease domain-containing protein [Ferruginibacter sp.]